MTDRKDIIDGQQAGNRKYGLIYTNKCGWVDLGHANPSGAARLWLQLLTGNQTTSKPQFDLSYSQMMGNRWAKVGVIRRYSVNSGLSVDQLKSVALSIFFDVSHSFETLQGNWLFKHFTNSGYSAEDLVSNLIGFYRAVEPGRDYIRLCDPVSKDIALAIWDRYGPVGQNKNMTTGPFIYPTTKNAIAGPMCVATPWFLNTVKPAKQGTLFTGKQ